MAVRLKGFNEILGDMVRKIVADTPVNDLNTGSVILTLLEAAAANDYENNLAILNVLELLNVDSLKNNDLDARASEFGLERKIALRSSGFVTITDSNITPRKTQLYPIKPAPIKGDNVIYVVDASTWDNTGGTLYLGRGTQNFEGPITYTSIQNQGSYYAIQLASSLEKNHLISEQVIDSQGTSDRRVLSGTIVRTPANNLRPEVEYRILREAVIPAGEAEVTSVAIQAIRPGSLGNAGIDTITIFGSIPFPGARVSNSNTLTNGRDIETDEDFRERIKSYANSLARGTKSAILSAIVGVSDQSESKQVESAVIVEPTENNEPSLLYIDDGSGFQPSFQGQSVDQLLKDAVGDEELLQLANFPLPRPQVVNIAEGPYQLRDGMELRVIVDGFEDIIQFLTADFRNIAAATPSELVIAINNKATLIEARLTENSERILIYTKAFDAEKIKVVAGTNFSNANSVIKFPVNELSYIALYQNNQRLRAREESGTLVTLPFATWQITQPGNLVISVDGTPSQDRTFEVNDFGGKDFNALTLTDWAAAFNKKYAGLTAQASQAGTLIIKSNREGSQSQLRVLGGTYFARLFNGQPTSGVGQDSDFSLNRQNGNVRLHKKIELNDSIQAGSRDTKGSVITNAITDGSFNVSTDAVGRQSRLIIVADASRVVPRSVILPIQEKIKLEDKGNHILRITAPSTTAFREIQPGDYLYLVNRGDIDGSGNGFWLDEKTCGLFRVTAKGKHLTAKVDSWIEIRNDGFVIGTPADTGIFGEYQIKDTADIQAFYSDNYPQIWNGLSANNPAAATISDIVASINANLINVKASIFRTNQIKLTSTTEEGGSIAVPVITGNISRLLNRVVGHRTGEFSHIANLRPQKDFITYFRRTQPVSENVFLDRYAYTDVKGSITTSVVPGTPGVDPYGEVLTDPSVLTPANVGYDNYTYMVDGPNKEVLRAIKQILPGGAIGTRQAFPYTLMDYMPNNRYNVAKTYEFSDLDNLVMILDDDAIAKTVDVRFARMGRVNSGSNSNTFIPDNISFSAFDADNETGIDFGNIQVWGTALNGTNFNDYAVWFRARNWYVTGGVGNGGASLMVRSREFGPVGENIKFQLEYPAFPQNQGSVIHRNFPGQTIVSYFFGSGNEKIVDLASGDIINISDLGGGMFRYTFPATVNLASIVVGDIMSITQDAGISADNRGTFRVFNVNDAGKYVDIYNPNGVVPQVGSPEEDSIVVPDDIPPMPAKHDIEITENGSAINQKYIVLFTPSSQGIGFFFNTTGAPATAPVVPGVGIWNEVVALTTDTAAQLTSKLHTVINGTSQFDSVLPAGVINVTNVDTGIVNLPTISTTLSATVTQTDAGLNDDGSYHRKYFLLQDQAGPVAVWVDLNNSGALEPSNPGLRSIRISTAVSGMTGAQIAAEIAGELQNDPAFEAIVVGNVITVTSATNGPKPVPDEGTMPAGFTITVTQTGINDVVEAIAIPTSFMFFPISANDGQTIADKLNEHGLLTVVAVNAGNFEYATRDEIYTPAGPTNYSQSLAYGHNPDPTSGNHKWISLYDSESWILNFQNSNPNFILKRELLLNGVAPSVYQMNLTENEDGSQGEYMKLIPRTMENTLHHLTQKALSQLQIISDVEMSYNKQRPQMKSLLLGSAGAIEIVGGRANGQTFSIIGDSQVEFKEDGSPLLQVKIPAFPATFSVGNHIRLENPVGAPRFSRLKNTDSIDVVKVDDEHFEYRYNPKACDFNRAVKFTITDVSHLYGRAGTETIWRWQFTDSGSFISLSDKTAGAVAFQPVALQSNGLGSAPGFIIETVNPSSASAALDFKFTVNSPLTQGDHLLFTNSAGISYALWISIDGNNAAPTSGQFAAATNKIRVNILSSDNDNTIVGKLATALITFSGFNTLWNLTQTLGANLVGVGAGDMLIAKGTLAGWSSTNRSEASGVGAWSGYPVIAVDESNRSFDIVNPNGKAMATPTNVGLNSKVQIMPTPGLRWRTGHYARPRIVQAIVIGNEAIVTLDAPHRLNVGDEIEVQFNAATPNGGGNAIVTECVDNETIKYIVDPSVLPAIYTGGLIKDVNKTVTKYAVEQLGYNNLFRLQWKSGERPKFFSSGVAVDDLLVIQGQTFFANNSGQFRVLAVEDDSIIFENASGQEQLDYLRPFNDLGETVQWTNSSAIVEGDAGAFVNLNVGDWVKKAEDEDTMYRQVISFNTGLAATATEIILGATYQGSTSAAVGIGFDQENDVGAGAALLNSSDIMIFEGDTVRARDHIFISETANVLWFSVNNTGTKDIAAVGTAVSDDRPFIRVNNPKGVEQQGRSIAVTNSQFIITENDDHRFSSVRMVEHVVIDEFNPQRRAMYLSPSDRKYKFTQTNKTQVTALGKLGFSTDIAKGVDGYTYYTGLLRTVQRIVDGYEPNANAYPGRKAVGAIIETLPPLIQRVQISLDVTTREGINITEITNDIKSTIIQYVGSLGVGQDVILSEVIVRVKNIEGVEAVTFISPAPSLERIPIADNEKAFIEPVDISIA